MRALTGRGVRSEHGAARGLVLVERVRREQDEIRASIDDAGARAHHRRRAERDGRVDAPELVGGRRLRERRVVDRSREAECLSTNS